MTDIFTGTTPFEMVQIGVEFLRSTGDVWRKIADDEADKVNAPGAGTIILMSKSEMVGVDLLDIRQSFGEKILKSASSPERDESE